MAELENTAALTMPLRSPVTSTFNLFATVYAADEATEFDQVTWAEKLTKQYDTLKGAKRYNQLAQQLGVDAKAAYEQMTIAQEIIHKGAMADADWNNKVVNILQATKTTSKVALLGLSLVATGGASVTVLEGAGFIASGIDCAIEVADTGSTIILGEGNNVAVGFGELKKMTAPVTSVIGLLNFDVANLQNRTKDSADALVYISDSILDLIFENKVLGMEISATKDGEVDTGTCTIEDNGDGTIAWISDDMDITTLYYEEGSRRIYYSGDGLNLEILFASGLGGVKGNGRMYGEFWGEPLDVDIAMTKQ